MIHNLIKLALSFILLLGSFQAHAEGAPEKSRFITLGTQGGPIPSKTRSQPANVLLVGQRAYLIDVGDAAAEQLTKSNVMIDQVEAIFISHLHFDHTGGLAALLGLRYQTSVTKKLQIFGPAGTKQLVAGIVASMAPSAEAGYGLPGAAYVDPETGIEVFEMVDKSRYKLADFTVSARKNTHYSFPKGGYLDRRFASLSFRFDLADRSIVYTGDTGPSVAVEELAKGADLLVSEMIDLDLTYKGIKRANPHMPEKALEGIKRHLSTHHLMPKDVGELAHRAGVKKLVVTHLVAAGATPDDLKSYIDEIHQAYAGPVTIAHDLEEF